MAINLFAINWNLLREIILFLPINLEFVRVLVSLLWLMGCFTMSKLHNVLYTVQINGYNFDERKFGVCSY
jgi:hypothetical protein